MSSLNSANRPSLFYNDENEALYDPYPLLGLGDPSIEPPWPEWNDAELNAELWDEGKVPKSLTANGGKGATFSRPLFDDPNPPTLPSVISDYIDSWKRPREVFVDENAESEILTVYDPSNFDFVLSVPSEFASQCEFLQVFMEEISILQFFGYKYRFSIELENPNFVSTTQGEIWRPWHSIYALCKAGKGQTHKPLYCPYGKYVVRLYYMGVWRKFIVDDKIPCDKAGNPLLPVTQKTGELWPIILTKALMKILALTPTNHYSKTDYHLMTSFTGWTYGNFLSRNKSVEQNWERLYFLLPLYERNTNYGQSNVELEPDRKSNPRNVTKKDSAKRESRREVASEDPSIERYCFVVAQLKSRDLTLECSVGLTMIRDCPLIKALKREKTKPWKKIRWIHWAKEKGLWVEEGVLPPYRRVQIVSYRPELRGLVFREPQPLEVSLYDIAVDDEMGAEKNENFPELWGDYLKLLEYLYDVDVFFKPSCFVSFARVSCLRPRVPDRPPSGKGTAKPVAPPSNLYYFPCVLKETCNEPIFLFFEGNTGIFMNIELTVYPRKHKHLFGYLERDQPKLLKISHASLIVEVHDWRSFEQGEILGILKTVGHSSINLNLRSGRYLLKVWLLTEVAYVIDIYSNVGVFVNNSSRVRFLMSNEPQRIVTYINNLANYFIAATLKFGKPDLPRALKEFYRSIRPGNDYTRNYLLKLDLFNETFLHCLLLSLKELIPSAEEMWGMMSALRTLFLNPSLKCDIPRIFEIGGKVSRQFLNYAWTEEEVNKVITIQRFFRGYRVRLLWKCQTPARKEYKLHVERLKKICDIMFSPQKRQNEVGKLLRRIILYKPDLLTMYKFYEDFTNVLHVEEFTGRMLNVEPYAWVPITRFVIGCHAEGPIPCLFHLSCNLEKVVILGFNNDTGEEIFRVTSGVSPHYYHSNVKGYTIFAFGWNEANYKNVNWRLEMVKMKHFQDIHLCNLLMSNTCKPYGIPNLELFEIRNFYVPNSKSRICRCLVKIQKRTILTLRLSLSYSKVHFELIISRQKGSSSYSLSDDVKPNVVYKSVCKNGVVLVPSLVLETADNSWDANATVYVVEAFVLNNSWPLTKQEWGLVEPFRVNGANGVNGESARDSATSLMSRRGRPESKKKIGRISRKSLIEQKVMDNPLWLLQVLNDSSGTDSGEQIVIEEDKSNAEALKAMKASWKEKDPGRRKRGRDLRMNFLYKIYLEKKKKLCGEDEENCEGEGEVEDPQWVLERLSSLSYLTNDTSPTRYTYSPRILPSMPLAELLCKYRKQTENYDLSSTQETEENSRSVESEISYRIVRNMMDEIEEDRKDFSRQCSHYRSVLINHMIEQQKLSNHLMEQAYEERQKALAGLAR